MKVLSTPIYAGAYAGVLALLFARAIVGQAQEGNNGIIDPGGDTAEISAIHDGYFSYVAEMDSAASVRQAKETLSWATVGSIHSWASKGSSWEGVQATGEVSSEAQVQTEATASQAEVEPVSTPTATPATASESTPSSNKSLAIGLGVGIPLALLAILSAIGIIIYKKRQSTRKDFEKRTAKLRDMAQRAV